MLLLFTLCFRKLPKRKIILHLIFFHTHIFNIQFIIYFSFKYLFYLLFNRLLSSRIFSSSLFFFGT